MAATELKLYTATPGFTAAIYGASSEPNLHDFQGSGWVPLTHSVEVAATRNFSLNTGGHDYRYYLVWITELPRGHESAAVNEVKLYR